MEQILKKNKIKKIKNWLDGRVIWRLFSLILIVSGIYQVMFAFMQLYGYQSSNNYLYAFTGTFLNPGPFCGYIAFILPLVLEEWFVWKEKSSLTGKIFQYIYAIVCVLFVVLLPAGMSRTAWLSAVFSSLFVISKHLQWKICSQLWVGFVTFLIIVGFFVTSVLLFHFKEDSVLGRLFVWKVTTQMIMNEPIVGHKNASFSSTYMDAQETYFKLHPSAPEWEKRVAETPEYAFNDYLQLAVEYGIPILILLLLLFACCFYFAYRQKRWGVCGAWISVGIFAFASYPLELPLFVVAIGLLGGASLIVPWQRNVNYIIRFILLLFIICGCVLRYDPVNHWQEANELFNYGLMLNRQQQYKKSNQVLKKTLRISGDPMILNVIGRNYQGMKRYVEAEQYYIRSITRRPNRLYPHYLLAKLYECADYYHPYAAKRQANIVLYQEPKVRSTAVKEMRRDMQRLIKVLDK